VLAVTGAMVEPDPGAPGSLCQVIQIPDCFDLTPIPGYDDPFNDGFNPAVPGSYHGWEAQPLPGETDVREVSGCFDFDPLDASGATMLIDVGLEAHLEALAPDEGYLDVVVVALPPAFGVPAGGEVPALPELQTGLLWVSIPAAAPLEAEVHRWDGGAWVSGATASAWNTAEEGPEGAIRVEAPLGALFDSLSPSPLDPTAPLGLVVATRVVFGPGDVNLDVAPDPTADGVLGVAELPPLTDSVPGR